jgi:hypothetical protein
MDLLCFLFAVGATFVLGIMALANGRIKLSPRRTVEGTSARWIGIVLLCAIPLAVLLVVLGFTFQVDPFLAIVFAYVVWFASVLLAVVIGAMTARTKSKTDRSEKQDAQAKHSITP